MVSGGVVDTLVWVAVFFVFSFLYPRFLLAQMISKLESAAQQFEEADRNARKKFLARIGKKGKGYEAMLREFQEMFVVLPSSLDPHGIVRKIDATLRQMEAKFEKFASRLGGGKNVDYGLRAMVSVHQIAKIVRHYVELVKKYKNLQIGFIIQMQLPAIKEIFESEIRGAEAFLGSVPVGDSIGPLLAASYMKRGREIAPGVVYDETTIAGRKAIVMKAKGPEPELGRMDEALEKMLKRRKVAKVITVDAALKLQGEKSGEVAEGVGFAMGGIVQREIIENILLPRKIPVEAVVCKIDMKEGIAPMTKEIYSSLPRLRKKVEELVKDTREKGAVVVVGVGNTSGVGNSMEWVEKAARKLRKIWARESKK